MGGVLVSVDDAPKINLQFFHLPLMFVCVERILLPRGLWLGDGMGKYGFNGDNKGWERNRKDRWVLNTSSCTPGRATGRVGGTDQQEQYKVSICDIE